MVECFSNRHIYNNIEKDWSKQNIIGVWGRKGMVHAITLVLVNNSNIHSSEGYTINILLLMVLLEQNSFASLWPLED